MKQVRPLELTDCYHSSNLEKTIPAESSVHQIPLDNTLMATADDFFLFVLVLAVELGLGAELDDEALAVSSPEISEHICISPISRQYMTKTKMLPDENTYSAGSRATISSSPRMAVLLRTPMGQCAIPKESALKIWT